MAEIEKLNQDLQAALQQNENTEKERKKLQTKSKSLQSALDEIKEIKKHTGSQLSDLQKELQESIATNHTIQEQKKDLQNQYNNHKNDREELIKAQSKAAKEHALKEKALGETVADLNQKIKELENALKLATNQVDGEKKSQRLKVTELESQLQATKKISKDLEKKVETLNASLETKMKTLKEKEGQIADLETAIKNNAAEKRSTIESPLLHWKRSLMTYKRVHKVKLQVPLRR